MSEYLKQSKNIITLFKKDNSAKEKSIIEKLQIIYIITLIILPIGGIIYGYQHIFIFKDNIEIDTILFLTICFIYLLWQLRLTFKNSNLAEKLGRIYFYFPVTFIWLFVHLNLFDPNHLEIDIVSPPIFIIILLLNCTIIYGYRDLTYLMIISSINFFLFCLVYIHNNLTWITNNFFLIIIFYLIFLIAIHLNKLTENQLILMTKKDEEKRNVILNGMKNNIKLYNSISHEFLTPIHSIQANLDELSPFIPSRNKIAFNSLNSILESIKFWSFYLVDYHEYSNFFVLNEEKIMLYDLIFDLNSILINNPNFISNKILIFIDSENSSIIIDKIRLFLIIMDSIKAHSNLGSKNEIIVNISVESANLKTRDLHFLIAQESNKKKLVNRLDYTNLSFVELNRKLVKKMKGNFIYEITEELFLYKIIIPLKEDEKSNYQKSTLLENEETSNLSILIVDDSKDNRFIIKSYLKDYQIDFKEAENGLEGFKILQSGNKFDLVLMDIKMPIMDGVDTTRKFREWEKTNAKSRTPIVFLTAYLNDVIDSIELTELVNEKILNKPFKKEELVKLISNI